VAAGPEDVGEALVLPDEGPLDVGQVDHVQRVAHVRVPEHRVEQRVLEARGEGVDHGEGVAAAAQQRAGEAVDAGRQELAELPVAEPQAALVLSDSDFSDEHDGRLPSGGGIQLTIDE
jgi:hypothetical protein